MGAIVYIGDNMFDFIDILFGIVQVDLYQYLLVSSAFLGTCLCVRSFFK